MYGPGLYFPTVNYAIGMRRLIDEGFLVPPTARAMPDAWETRGLEVRGGEFVTGELTRLVANGGKIMVQVADALPRLDGRQRIVWTCVSIEHAEAVGNELAKAGERLAVIHSRSPDAEYAMQCFERGDVRHAVSVMMLSEGVDIPSVDAVVLMRPTRSPTLAVQTVGRGLRPYPGKRDCVVLDYGQVIENCGPVDAPYINEKRRRAGEKFTPTIRVCSECLEYVPHSVAACPKCGHVERGVERRLAAEAAELARKAAEIAMLAASQPQEYECLSATASQYVSSKGNNCIRLTITLRDRIQPVHIYGSEHPYSWEKIREHLYKLTPFRFNSWRECYEAIPSFGRSLEAPRRITVKQEKGFDKVVGVYN
jgi:superfamily II DNA or RNA helicase